MDKSPDAPEAGERRWTQNALVKGDLPGVGRKLFNATSTPLEAYAYAGFISPRQYEAGAEIRDWWCVAGREPRMVAPLEKVYEGPPQMSDKQARAWGRFVQRMKKLMPAHASGIHSVCCLGDAAEIWAQNRGAPAHLGLLMLRDALEELAGVR